MLWRHEHDVLTHVIISVLAGSQRGRPVGGTMTSWRPTRRAYRTVDHVPDREVSSAVAGTAISSSHASTIALFLARYGSGDLDSSTLQNARRRSSIGGWLTIRIPAVRAIVCASASAPTQSP